MESQSEEIDRDGGERRSSNTEYTPTKCRTTRPQPPKPATNPLQFVKVQPCELYRKAQEQIKKVEEVKVIREVVKEDAEDWQHNLDNWKSSRRKRQEHIIERVVEVKKMEQEEHDKGRRKTKTFSEMLGDKSRGRHKLNIPIYDDDSNDLSDYGIGSSSSKTNSIKDVDTDDNSSVLDDRDITQFDCVVGNKETSTSSRSQSEDETNTKQTNAEHANSIKYSSEAANNSSDSSNSSKAANKNMPRPTPSSNNTLPQTVLYSEPPSEITEQYTYEGAIQDYRTRIRSKINVGEAVFGKQSAHPDVSKSKEFSEAQNLLPKGNLFKRKEIFDKSVEISSYESTTVRRLSEDFAHSQSIKERLQCLEKCTDQPLRPVEKGDAVGSVKSKVQSFIKQSEVVADVKNNNSTTAKTTAKPTADSLTSMLNNNKTIASYLMEKSSSNSSFEEKNDWRSNKEYFERTASPESEMFMNKLNEFNRDLDTIYGKSGNLDEFVTNCNYPASTSSTELMALSSDREDSGIHTADVSCSVSQADEPFDDADISSQTIPSCIEKLTKENDKYNPTEEAIPVTATAKPTAEDERILETVVEYVEPPPEVESTTFSNTFLRDTTLTLLDSERRESLQSQQMPESHSPLVEHIEKTIKHDNLDEIEPDLKLVIYENVELKPKKIDLNPVQSYFNMDSFSVDLEPPNIKPPPPPPTDDNTDEEDTPELVPSTDSPVKRINSTKRIKKELHIKRSSFLGLEEPTDDQIEPGLALQRPPDINSFLQQESLREKSLQKTLQMSREQRNSCQDSDAVRRSQRQDSELTVSSFTSEEDEISKKEREIIEMVEKEEKSRDYEYVGPVVETSPTVQPVETVQPVTPFTPAKSYANNYDNNLGSEKFDTPFFPQHYEPIDAQDSEVLKVEHELLQLEREELERQRENQLFRENRAKLLQNRHSYENICDVDFTAQQQIQQKQQHVAQPNYPPNNQVFEYRKSMPDLPHLPLDYRNSLPNNSVSQQQQVRNVNVAQQVPVMLPADDFHFHRKSMPDIQHAYNRSIAEYRGTQSPLQPESGIGSGQLGTAMDYRKSMPELLQDDVGASRRQFALPGSSNSSTSGSSGVSNRAMIGDKPIRHFIGGKEQREKERFMMLNPVESDALHNTTPPSSVLRPLTRHSLHALSAAPKSRQMDNWLQPKPHSAAGVIPTAALNGAVATAMSSHHHHHHHATAAAQAQAQPPELMKHYNQHWLCQEAELRRLAELKSPAQQQRLLHTTAGTNNSNGVGNRPLMPNAKPPAKHIPEAVIQKLTQRVQNRGLGERAPPAARINNLVRPEISHQPAQLTQQSAHSYLGHPSTFGHALPMPYGQFSTSAATAEEYPDNTKLSVSGKKKCSYCGIELGRGAAMIIETLCLFYHMDCFKCSVCRTALGDGMIGTDVRVRNDKLHCHNCYSNEDGVKYSCV